MTLSLPQIAGSSKLTHSRRSCHQTCPRKHYFQYELGVRPDHEATPLRIGSAVHLGLESRAKGFAPSQAVDAAIAGYETLPLWANTEEKVHEWMVERMVVACLLNGYFWYWENDCLDPAIDPVEYLETEVSFELPIVNPETGAKTPTFTFGGKTDAIVKLRDGRLAVMEHKTCSEDLDPTSDYWTRLRIDSQISGYFHAARERGKDVQTVLYDVIRKPTIKPRQIPLLDDNGLKIVVDAEGKRCLKENIKKDGTPGAGHGEPYQSPNAEKGWVMLSRIETPNEYAERLTADIAERPQFYYARQEIPRLDSDLNEFKQDLWQYQQHLRESQRSGRWYRNTAACTLFGRCPYLAVCATGIDPANPPSGFTRVADLHPELAGE